jgi:predicted DNA-binding transcriptional regulator YafY
VVLIDATIESHDAASSNVVSSRNESDVDRSANESLLDRSSRGIDPRHAVGKTERRPPGLGREELKIAVLRVLELVGEQGATKAEIVARIRNTTLVSVQRALDDLRELHDAKIVCVGKERRWKLVEAFGMPLVAPDREDLVAVLVAQAILEPIADAELKQRLDRLVADVDERVRNREPDERKKTLPTASSVSATLTLGTPVKPEVLRTLLATCKRKVLQIEYDAPWKPAGEGRRSYEIEPWALRVHDGGVYLRAWRRDASAPRTFRVAQIESMKVLDTSPRGRIPAPAEVWGDENPAFGIDADRPDVAVVRLRGPIARWVKRMVWHADQIDRWIIEPELLERTVAYRSCRELARRLASLLDGIESIAPETLRGEVEAIVAKVPRTMLEREAVLESSVDSSLPGVMYRVPASAATRTATARAADGGGDE